jgi:hypothetical protein
MDHIDRYCERTSQGLWAESLNTLSNLAFFLGAWWLWHEARSRDQLSSGVKLLLFWLVAFGMGSLLFHTFANTPTRWLDVLPIALFIITYLCLYAYRVAGLSLAITAALTVFLQLRPTSADSFPTS